jgi:hypothetical protein
MSITTEEVLKEILRGDPQLSSEAVREAVRPGSPLGPALVALIKNVRLWHTEDAGLWAVLHAIRLVSGLHLKEAMPALIDAIFLAYSARHEDALDDLPVALAQTGPAAVIPLTSIVEDRALNGTIRSVAASALEGIAVMHPDSRDDILTTLRKIISSAEESSSLRSHVISIVAHFRLAEDLRLIKNTTRAMPMMSELETDEIDEYFERGEDPEAWNAYRASLLEYYE